jgi:hypothetical protein
MKAFSIFLLIAAWFSSEAQIYVQLTNVNNKATFQATATVDNADQEAIQETALAWIEETFLSEDVITSNVPGNITAKYNQDYSDGTWSGQYEHTLQISITDGQAVFTISDTKMGLIRSDGTWKEHLGKMKAMYEQEANEHFWAFEKRLKAGAGK